jgi:anti-sigma B factor antagonist
VDALLIKSGKAKGTRLLLPDDKQIVIGRDPVCDIRLSSRDVSNVHCIVRASIEGLLVSDMDSKNGTLVNDVAIRKETLLKRGDLLTIGPLVFEVVPKTAPASDGPQTGDGPGSASEDSILDWLSDDAAPGETTGGEVAKSDATGRAGARRLRSYRHILFKNVSDVAVVYFAKTKKLSARNYEQAINELYGLVECEGYKRIVLNFSDVEYIHSTALASLADFDSRLKADGGVLRLCNLHPVLRELFEATQSHSLFDIRDDEPSALRAFR